MALVSKKALRASIRATVERIELRQALDRADRAERLKQAPSSSEEKVLTPEPDVDINSP